MGSRRKPVGDTDLLRYGFSLLGVPLNGATSVSQASNSKPTKASLREAVGCFSRWAKGLPITGTKQTQLPVDACIYISRFLALVTQVDDWDTSACLWEVLAIVFSMHTFSKQLANALRSSVDEDTVIQIFAHGCKQGQLHLHRSQAHFGNVGTVLSFLATHRISSAPQLECSATAWLSHLNEVDSSNYASYPESFLPTAVAFASSTANCLNLLVEYECFFDVCFSFCERSDSRSPQRLSDLCVLLAHVSSNGTCSRSVSARIASNDGVRSSLQRFVSCSIQCGNTTTELQALKVTRLLVQNWRLPLPSAITTIIATKISQPKTPVRVAASALPIFCSWPNVLSIAEGSQSSLLEHLWRYVQAPIDTNVPATYDACAYAAWSLWCMTKQQHASTNLLEYVSEQAAILATDLEAGQSVSLSTSLAGGLVTVHAPHVVRRTLGFVLLLSACEDIRGYLSTLEPMCVDVVRHCVGCARSGYGQGVDEEARATLIMALGALYAVSNEDTPMDDVSTRGLLESFGSMACLDPAVAAWACACLSTRDVYGMGCHTGKLFARLLEGQDTTLTDVVFVFPDGVRIAAHSSILAARCATLAGQLAGLENGGEKKVKCPSRTFRHLLRYLYTGTVGPLTPQETSHLLVLTKQCRLVELQRHIARRPCVPARVTQDIGALWLKTRNARSDTISQAPFTDCTVVLHCTSQPGNDHVVCTVAAHRVMLAARCDFFAALLRSGMRDATDRTIHLHTPCPAEPPVLTCILEYLYTGTIIDWPRSLTQLVHTITLARSYGIVDLIGSLERRAKEVAGEESGGERAVGVWRLGLEWEVDVVAEVGLGGILKSYEKIERSGSIAGLPGEMADYLRDAFVAWKMGRVDL